MPDYKRKHMSEAIEIPVDKIKLSEQIHKRGNPDYQYKSKPNEDCLLIVRKCCGDYILMSGWGDYMECLLSGYKTVKAIICGKSKKEIFRQYSHTYIPIADVVIPRYMKKSCPKKWKLSRVYYRLGDKNQLDRPLTLTKDNVLIDGYTRYIVAKKIGMKFVPVLYAH